MRLKNVKVVDDTNVIWRITCKYYPLLCILLNILLIPLSLYLSQYAYKGNYIFMIMGTIIDMIFVNCLLYLYPLCFTDIYKYYTLLKKEIFSDLSRPYKSYELHLKKDDILKYSTSYTDEYGVKHEYSKSEKVDVYVSEGLLYPQLHINKHELSIYIPARKCLNCINIPNN